MDQHQSYWRHSPVIISSTYCKLYLFTLHTVVPIPTVTATAPNTQIVGQLLTLECSVRAVRGITSRVNIIWSRSGVVLNQTNDILPSTTDSLLMYTDTYTISLLSTDDDGREYQCEVAIDTNPPVMATGSVSLDVMGECDTY